MTGVVPLALVDHVPCEVVFEVGGGDEFVTEIVVVDHTTQVLVPEPGVLVIEREVV